MLTKKPIIVGTVIAIFTVVFACKVRFDESSALADRLLHGCYALVEGDWKDKRLNKFEKCKEAAEIVYYVPRSTSGPTLVLQKGQIVAVK